MIYGLQRDWFVGEQIWNRETQQIFNQHWVCVGRQEHLFDDSAIESFCCVTLDESDLVIVRRKDQSCIAFHNTCRHRGTRLVDQPSGPIKNSCITCPYHAWTYDTDGTLIGAPNMQEVPDFDRSQFGLHGVNCVNWNGFIMVCLNTDATDLDHEFAPLNERLQPWDLGNLILKSTLTYQVQANWKLVFQNYSECYHCPTVHPDLNRLTPYRGATNDLEEGSILGGPMQLSEDSQTVSTDGQLTGEYLPDLNQTQRRLVYYYTIFPSMFISAHPDYVMVHVLQRVSNDKTRVDCHFLTLPSTQLESLQRAVQQWDEVNRQDWRVCELTQKGIQSPAYQPGPYSNLEPMLMAFDRHYRKVMDDTKPIR